MDFFVDKHEEFFTPWVKQWQIDKSLKTPNYIIRKLFMVN
jgi:hypothetical protein